jgi:hypothetical protein
VRVDDLGVTDPQDQREQEVRDEEQRREPQDDRGPRGRPQEVVRVLRQVVAEVARQPTALEQQAASRVEELLGLAWTRQGVDLGLNVWPTATVGSAITTTSA